MPNAAASRLVLQPFDEPSVIQAAREALAQAGGHATIGFAFASLDYQPHLPDFLELLQLHGHLPLLVGCGGSGLIGAVAEAELQSGFSLLLLHLPETTLHPVTLTADMVEQAASGTPWPKLTGIPPEAVDTWLLLGDPFGFPVEPWLQQWNAAYPGIPTLGALGSGSRNGTPEEETFVFLNRETLPPGSALLIGLKGGVALDCIVAQGCRPIGEPLTITRTDGNLLLTIGGKPAYAALTEAFESLSDEEKNRAQGNLFVGLAHSEYIDTYQQGDFLIRTILGADAATGAVAIGAYPRIGQTLQWQLRDGPSAHTALEQALQRRPGSPPFASLLFSCVGRGRELFSRADHDVGTLARILGPLPTAGFFCNGEVGPIGQTNHIHGYTASIALFSNR